MKKELLAAGVTAVATIALSQVVVNAEDVVKEPQVGKTDEKETQATSPLAEAEANVEKTFVARKNAYDEMNSKEKEYKEAKEEKRVADDALETEENVIKNNVTEMHSNIEQTTTNAKTQLNQTAKENDINNQKVKDLTQEVEKRSKEKDEKEEALKNAETNKESINESAKKQLEENEKTLNQEKEELTKKEAAYNSLTEKDPQALQKAVNSKQEEQKQNEDKIAAVDKILNRPTIELWLSQDDNVVKGDDYKNTYQIPTPSNCLGKPEYSYNTETDVEGVEIDENGLVTAKEIFSGMPASHDFRPDFYPQKWEGVVTVQWTDTNHNEHEDLYNVHIGDYDYAQREKQYQKTLDTITKDSKATKDKITSIVNYVAQEKYDKNDPWAVYYLRNDLYHLLALAHISVETRPEITEVPEDAGHYYTNDMISYKNEDGTEHGFIVDLNYRDSNGKIRFEELENISKDIQNVDGIPTYIAYSGGNTKEVRIPGGVVTLGYGDYSFSSHHIDHVYIPASVKEIKDLDLYNGVGYFDVASNNMYYKSINGDVYTYDGSELVLAGDAKEKMVVAEGAKRISSMAFLDRYQDLVFPESLEELHAYLANSSYKKLIIPKNVKEINMSDLDGTDILVIEGKNTKIDEIWERGDYMNLLTLYAPADSEVAQWAKTATKVKFIPLTDDNRAEALQPLPEEDSRILPDFLFDDPYYVSSDEKQEYIDYKTYLQEQVDKTNKDINKLKSDQETINDYQKAQQAVLEAQKKYDDAKKTIEGNILAQLEQEAKDAKDSYQKVVSELDESKQKAQLSQQKYDNALAAYKKAKEVQDKALLVTGDDAIKGAITDPEYTYLNGDVKKLNALRDAAIKANAIFGEKEEAYNKAKAAYNDAIKDFEFANDTLYNETLKAISRVTTKTVINSDKHQDDQNTNVTAQLDNDTIINLLGDEDYEKVYDAFLRNQDVNVEVDYGLDAVNANEVAMLLDYAKKDQAEVIDFFSLGIKVKAGDTTINVHSLEEPITYKLDLTHINKANRDFYVLRVHDNKVEKLAVSITGNTGSFTSDKYSTFALVAKNRLVNTAVEANTKTISNTNANVTVKQVNKSTTNTTTVTTKKKNSTKVVETGDSTVLFNYITLAGISIIGMIKCRKKARQ